MGVECESCVALEKALYVNTLANPTWGNVLVSASVLLGLIALISLSFSLLTVVAKAVWPAPKLRKYGKWAVVTGASDGIGFAYAVQLAKQGLSVVLISRSAENLAKSAADLRAKFPSVEVRTIQADFSSGDASLYDNIAKQLEGLEIGVLVNNVGISYPSALYFHELENIEPGLSARMIAVNVGAVTHMTRLVLPAMVARRSGAIINVSSAAGRIPIGNPLYAVYSASKAYVDYFSRSLNSELKSFGIVVQCQSPYFVTTKMSRIRKATATVPTPDEYAKAAVKAIGCGASVVPFWTHNIQDVIIRSLPTALLSWGLVKMHLGIRKAFMKKRTEKKE